MRTLTSAERDALLFLIESESTCGEWCNGSIYLADLFSQEIENSLIQNQWAQYVPCEIDESEHITPTSQGKEAFRIHEMVKSIINNALKD